MDLIHRCERLQSEGATAIPAIQDTFSTVVRLTQSAISINRLTVASANFAGGVAIYTNCEHRECAQTARLSAWQVDLEGEPPEAEVMWMVPPWA